VDERSRAGHVNITLHYTLCKCDLIAICTGGTYSFLNDRFATRHSVLGR